MKSISVFVLGLVLSSSAFAQGYGPGHGTSSFAGSTELVCDNSDDRPVSIIVRTSNKEAVIYNGTYSVKTTPSKFAPIIKGELAKMDKVVITDLATKVSFRVDGQDVYGAKRLGITFSVNGESETFSSCIIYEAPVAGF